MAVFLFAPQSQLIEALAYYEGQDEPVVVYISECLTKAELGEGERWITVHPPGHEKGQPVLVRETKKGSGVYHVIGGAGGKLNYLKLRGVKSKEHYRKEAAEKKKARVAERKVRREREKESGIYQAKQQAHAEVTSQQRQQEREFINTVAEAMGWKGHEFDPNPYLNLSEAAQKKVAARHHREWLRKARKAVDTQRQRLLHDADARAAALDTIPLLTQDPEVLSVEDLAPVPKGASLGYSTDYAQRASERGLGEEELKQEKGEHVQESEAGKKRRASAEAIAEELKNVRDPTAKDADIKLADAQKAAALLRAEKKLQAIQRQAREARKDIEKTEEPRGAYVLKVSEADIDAEAIKGIEDDLKTAKARAFLSEVGKVADDPDKALGRHIGVGAYNAINAVSLTSAGTSLVDRDVVDVIGIAGAAQVLARRLHADLTPEELDDLRQGLSEYHVDHYMQATEDAMAEAMRWQDAAKDIEIESAESARDLVRLQELNNVRREAIGNAERIMGITLGEVEANAALVTALQADPEDGIEVNLGPVSVEDAIRRVRAIGLERGDYKIHSVGGERFLSITGHGMDRLTKPVNRADLDATRRSIRIIEGHEDEEDWLPKGVANRPDLAMRVPPGVAPRLAEPFEPGPDIEKSVRDYIGGRAADGDAPADIVADLLSEEFARKVQDRDAYFAAVNKLVPLKDKDGKLLRVESHQEAFQSWADQYIQERYGHSRHPIHRQSVPVDGASVDSLHRALAAEPAGTVAFKPVGELDRKEQRVLRDWWAKEIGYKDEGAAEMRAELSRLDEAEPEREVDDMFGRGVNPMWTEWKQRRDELAEKLGQFELTWPKYVKVMGGHAQAYSAVQDIVRGRVAKRFADAYNTLRPESPIKIGRTVINHNLQHMDAVDPEARERRMEKHRELVDSLRERVAGRYASGAVSDRIAAAREAQAAIEQSQMGFFGAEDEPAKETPLAADQRHTIGHAAERQLAGMMSVVGKNFKSDQPTKLWKASMNGKFINQQRAVKLIDANKRVVLAQGVGSGKTVIMLSGLTHAIEQGKAKRGLFIVPSIVQGQFSGEALRYLEPGKYKWHIEPGASREERIAGYLDPENHFSVVTHQSFRDDMVYLAAKQAGIDEATMTEKVKAMTTAERKAWMREVMDKAGMDHDYLGVDEGHDLLNRAGKEDSLLANVVDSVAHNTPYFVSASADPVKNDPSEIFSLLNKMDPERFSDQRAFMRRYGVDTPAAKNELRRVMAQYFYPGRIDSGVNVDRKEQHIPLTDAQKAAIADADRHLANVRLARMKGQVDVDAVKALSPGSFEGVDESRHKEVAAKLAKSIGPLREVAMRRILDDHPESAKVEAASKTAAERKGKPGVIFTHSLTAVQNIADRLRREGHRVVMISGKDSSKEKTRKKLMFNPESGEAQADILVASDAAAVGMNAQRGQWLVNYDTPDTAKTHAQRNGRIDRTGQMNDTIELIDFVADHPRERRARKRLADKYELRGIMTSPLEGLDDTGLASYLNKARMEREQAGLF